MLKPCKACWPFKNAQNCSNVTLSHRFCEAVSKLLSTLAKRLEIVKPIYYLACSFHS